MSPILVQTGKQLLTNGGGQAFRQVTSQAFRPMFKAESVVIPLLLNSQRTFSTNSQPPPQQQSPSVHPSHFFKKEDFLPIDPESRPALWKKPVNELQVHQKPVPQLQQFEESVEDLKEDTPEIEADSQAPQEPSWGDWFSSKINTGIEVTKRLLYGPETPEAPPVVRPMEQTRKTLSERAEPLALDPETAIRTYTSARFAEDVYRKGGQETDAARDAQLLADTSCSPLKKSDLPAAFVAEVEGLGGKVDEEGYITHPKVGLQMRLFNNEKGGVTAAIAGSSMNPIKEPRAIKNWFQSNIPNFIGKLPPHDTTAVAICAAGQNHGIPIDTAAGHSLAGGTSKFLAGMLRNVEAHTYNAAGITKAHEALIEARGLVKPKDLKATNVVSSNDEVTRANSIAETVNRVWSGENGLSQTSGTPGRILTTGVGSGHGMSDLVPDIKKQGVELLKLKAPVISGPPALIPEPPPLPLPEASPAKKTVREIIAENKAKGNQRAQHPEIFGNQPEVSAPGKKSTGNKLS